MSFLRNLFFSFVCSFLSLSIHYSIVRMKRKKGQSGTNETLYFENKNVSRSDDIWTKCAYQK